MVKNIRCFGYHIFVREYYAVVHAKHPDLSTQEVFSVVVKSWNDVSKHDNAEYNRPAKMKTEDSKTVYCLILKVPKNRSRMRLMNIIILV